MKKLNISRFISIGGILTTFVILFQSAPLFLPVIGLALSPFSTLPIAIASVFHVSLGITVFFSSALLLSILSSQETIILLFTTGLLGFVMGTLLYRKGIIISIIFSGITLSLGMIFLTYIVRISGFVDFTNSIPISLTIFIYLAFSFTYAIIWNICFRKFMDYLIKINSKLE